MRIHAYAYPSGLTSAARTISVWPSKAVHENVSSTKRIWEELVITANKNFFIFLSWRLPSTIAWLMLLLSAIGSEEASCNEPPGCGINKISRISSLHPITWRTGTRHFDVDLSLLCALLCVRMCVFKWWGRGFSEEWLIEPQGCEGCEGFISYFNTSTVVWKISCW